MTQIAMTVTGESADDRSGIRSNGLQAGSHRGKSPREWPRGGRWESPEDVAWTDRRPLLNHFGV